MQSKSLLIAIAAFAVTTTGVQAYGYAILERANLTEEQRSALEEAHILKENGNKEAARNLLVEAGIDEKVIHSLRKAVRETKLEVREAVKSGDYNLFKELIAGTPLNDIITSEEDFEIFREAHELKETGDYEGAKTLFDELGIKKPEHHHRFSRHHTALSNLSDEQKEALRVAKQANDRETVNAILDEVGI